MDQKTNTGSIGGRRIARLFLDGTPIKYDWRVTQKVDENNIVTLGERVGPTYSHDTLLHEMCHLVEIDDDRTYKNGWGLKYRSIFVIDRYCDEPLTTKSTERELRVLAYQMNLTEHLGYPFAVDNITSLEWMCDFINVKWKTYRREVRRGSHDFRSDHRVARRLCQRVWRMRDTYTYKRFESEWERKVKLLEKVKRV